MLKLTNLTGSNMNQASFYELFKHNEIHLFKEVEPSYIFQYLMQGKQTENIDYFLTHFQEKEWVELDAINKFLLFSVLNLNEWQEEKFIKAQKKQGLHYFFSIQLFTQSFEKDETLLEKVVNYFDTELNFYFESYDCQQNMIVSINALIDYFKIYHGVDYTIELTTGNPHQPVCYQMISKELTSTQGLAKIRALLYSNVFNGEIENKILKWIDHYEEKQKIEQKIIVPVELGKSLKI